MNELEIALPIGALGVQAKKWREEGPTENHAPAKNSDPKR